MTTVVLQTNRPESGKFSLNIQRTFDIKVSQADAKKLSLVILP